MSPINLSWIYLSEVKEILKQVVYSFFPLGKEAFVSSKALSVLFQVFFFFFMELAYVLNLAITIN